MVNLNIVWTHSLQILDVVKSMQRRFCYIEFVLTSENCLKQTTACEPIKESQSLLAKLI